RRRDRCVAAGDRCIGPHRVRAVRRTCGAAAAAARVDLSRRCLSVPGRDVDRRIPAPVSCVPRRPAEASLHVRRGRLQPARIGDVRIGMTSYDQFLSPLGRNLHESVLRKMGQVIASRTGDLISFAAGYPDPTGFPWDEFREIANELLSGKDGSVLQYGPTRGYRPLLESILGVLDGRGITADLPQAMTTSGSQQGLDLVAPVL